MSQSPRLASRLMTAQVLVVAVGAVTPVIAAGLVAPQLFHLHLMQAGVTDSPILIHAEAAFRSSLTIAVGLGVIMSLVAASIVSWFLVRRIASPIEQLAAATQQVAVGQFDVHAPVTSFSVELADLAESFQSMADQLAAADAARGRMLADLAHEVRTPLATLQAYVDGMQDGVIETDTQAWDSMRRQIERLGRLAQDIRAVQAAEDMAVVLAPVDACAVTAAATEEIAPRYAAKGVQLHVPECDRPCIVAGDPLRLQQVLGNLLDNALRHTQLGGTVTVTVSAAGDACTIGVADNGEGMPADQLERVFDRLHRVDPSRASTDGSGSGLGLTIARAIVRAHHGSITASSAGPGLGSSVVVELPLL